MKIFLIILTILFIPNISFGFPELRGRIAISSDGNNHDCDDITASAFTIMLLARSGNAPKLVYYGHSDHIWSSNTVETCTSVTDREVAMHDSTYGVAEQIGGFDLNVFYNARANTAAAVAKLALEMSNSSATNPLWVIAAGPMEVIGQALSAANANKKYVVVISHSLWNDNHADNPEGGEVSHSGWTWNELKVSFPTVRFKHIQDQNTGLTTSDSEYNYWLQNSYDPLLDLLWDRRVLAGTPDFDPSDAGMLYWLLHSSGRDYGDEGATPRKLRFVLEPMVFPASGNNWNTATPEEAGFDTTRFNAALNALPDKSIIIKDGYIIGTKGNSTTTGLIWSASKTLTALIFSRQLQLGNVTYDENVPNSDFPTPPLATYRQFLNMTSDYGLDPHSPGNNHAYNNGAVHHYGTHLKTTFYSGNNHVQTLQNAYVTTLGFQDILDYPTTSWAGLNHMSGWNGGWSMSARDFARIAHLMLNRGKWKSTQVINADFCDQLFIHQVPPTSNPNPDLDDPFFNEGAALTDDVGEGYSFATWLPHLTDRVGGVQSRNEAIAMSGAFGTTAFISREHNLIVLNVNSGGESTNDNSVKINGAMFDSVVEALSTTFYIRTDGGTTSQCNGKFDIAYDGAGTNEPCAFNNLQDGINATSCDGMGDFVKLKEGQTFSGNFILTDKGTCNLIHNPYITITTTNVNSLPTKLTQYPSNFSETDSSQFRITTAEASNMPKIKTPNGNRALELEHAAHNWFIDGIEVTNTSTFTGYLIGTSTAPESTLAEFAFNNKFERVFVHPKEETGDITVNYQERSVEKGLGYNGKYLNIKYSAFQGFTGWDIGSTFKMDTNAVILGFGEGFWTLENSLFEGSSNTLWLGGGGSLLVPSNHIATMSNPTITSGTLSNLTDLQVGDLFSVEIEDIANTLITNQDDPNGTTPVPILSGFGVGKVETINGSNITFGNLTSAYNYRRFHIKFGTGVTGGTFTLTYFGQTTSAISFSSNRTTLANNIRTALENLSNLVPADLDIVDGNGIHVQDPTYGVEVLFANSTSLALPANFTSNGTNLIGSGVVTIRVEPFWSEHYSNVHPSHAPEIGAEVRWSGIVPTDVIVRRNIIHKPQLWTDFMGPQKGYGEVKSSFRLTLEANIFHSTNTGFIFENKNQGGDSPWSEVSLVTYRYNIITKTKDPLAIVPVDGANRAMPSKDYLMEHNLFLNPVGTGDSSLFGNSTVGGSNFILRHNTIFVNNRLVFAPCGIDDPEEVGFSQLKNWDVYDNFIQQRGGFFLSLPQQTNPPYNFGDIRDCWPDMDAQNNAIIDDTSSGNPQGFFTQHPNNWQITDTLSNILLNFVNAPTSLTVTGNNYRVANGSLYKAGNARDATDNTDVGANIDLIISNLGFDPFLGTSTPKKCNWNLSPICNQ